MPSEFRGGMNRIGFHHFQYGGCMIVFQIIACFLVGFACGTGGMWLLLQNSSRMKTQKIHQLEKDVVDKQIAIAVLEIRLSEWHRNTEEKLTLLTESREQLKSTFQQLASEILDDKSKKFAEQNKENISGILSPLREQLSDFKKRVEDVYDKESQGRAALVNEVTRLRDLNQRISVDAVN